jgi:hypothetical protein
MKQSGKKSVDSSNIPSDLSRNIDDAFYRKNKRLMNSVSLKREAADCVKALPGSLIVMRKDSSTKMSLNPG